MAQFDNVAGLLVDAGIKLKSLAPGRNEHVICPNCAGGKTRETSLSVTVDPDGNGFTAVCHRGTCGWRHGGRVHDSAPRQPRKEEPRKRPIAHPPSQQSIRPDWLFEFFAERNIGARTVEKFGVYAMTRRFPDPIGESRSLVFPYVWKGEVVNRKYRPDPAKTPQLQEKDALPTLFNIDACEDMDEIIFVEGEPDVMALWEIGYPAVSLKDGAPSRVSDGNEKRFEALATHAEQLGKVRKFILAGDMDGPGLALREELARRLGRHRCWLVTWPEGCKDACDTLRVGAEEVERAIADAEPYPIEGLHAIKKGTLASLRLKPPPPIMTTGTRASDEILKFPGEGRLIVLTGYPSAGKTSWMRFAMVHTAIDHDRRWVVFSPESQPWEQFAAQCAEVYVGRPFYRDRGIAAMNDDEIAEAEDWLSDRVVMLVCDAEDQAPTLEWLLDRGRSAVLQWGCTDFLIDPWNEVYHQRGDQSETDYTGTALQRLKSFAQRHGVNVWIATHPRIPPPAKPGETRAAPGPYEISGSAHWANKADLGLTIHGNTPAQVGLHLWKARFRRWGKKGTMAEMEFDPVTGRYRSAGSPLVEGMRQVAEPPAPYNGEFQL